MAIEMNNDSATIETGALAAHESLSSDVQISFDELMQHVYEDVDREASKKAFDYLLTLPANSPHRITLSGPFGEDYIATYDPQRNLGNNEALAQDRTFLEQQIKALEPLVAGEGERGRNTFENKRKLQRAKKERLRIGMTLDRTPKMDDIPLYPAYDPEAVSGSLADRIASSPSSTSRTGAGKAAHAANALAAVPLVMSPMVNEHAVSMIKSFVVPQPESEQFQILASVAFSDHAQLKEDPQTGTLYQIVTVNGKSLRVNLDKTQVKYVEYLRDRLAHPNQTIATKKYSIYTPFLNQGVLRKDIGQPGPPEQRTETPTPVATGTPTPADTPTKEATKMPEQGPVDIQSEAPVVDADAHVSPWRLARVAAGSVQVKGEYKGDRLMSDGKTVEKELFIIGGHPELVSPGQVDDSDIVKHFEAAGEDLPSLNKSILEGPFTVDETMGGTFIDSYIQTGSQQNIDYSVNAHTDPNGVRTSKDYGASTIQIVNGRNFLALNYDSRGSSIYLVNRDTQRLMDYKVDVNISGRPVTIHFEGDRNFVQLKDGRNGNIIHIKDGNGNNLDELQLPPGFRFDASLWSVEYIGSANTLTVDNIDLEVKNGTRLVSSDVLVPEQEKGNGLNQFSNIEALVVSAQSLDLVRTPDVGNILAENATFVDFSQGDMFKIATLINADGTLEFHNWDSQMILDYLDRKKFEYALPIDVRNMSEKDATTTYLQRNITLLTKDRVGQPIVVRGLFKPDGTVDTEIPLLKSYRNDTQSFTTDLVARLNTAGAPVRFVFPKTDKQSFEKMFHVVQGLKIENQIEGVNVDIGGLSTEDALDGITRLQALGIKVRVYVSDNLGGLSLQNIVAITELTGCENRIIEISGDKKDTSKRYIINSVDNGNTSDANYSATYFEYRDDLGGVLADKGRASVDRLITSNVSYFLALKDSQDGRWQKVVAMNQVKGIDVNDILDKALHKSN